jgi:hypothetical protein
VPNHTSSNRPFDKFAWLRAVLADDVVTLGEKAVLSYVAVFDVRNGSDTFCVRQDTIASRCATSESTVSRAIRHAKRLGYLALAQSRKPGWGQHGADVLRLTLPEKSSVKLTTDSPGWNGESPVKLTADSAASPVDLTKVMRQIDGYIEEYGSLNGSLKGGGEESQVNLTADSPRPPHVQSILTGQTMTKTAGAVQRSASGINSRRRMRQSGNANRGELLRPLSRHALSATAPAGSLPTTRTTRSEKACARPALRW